MQFTYQIRTQQGDVKNGMVEAQNRNAAIETLQRSHFIIIRIEDASAAPFFSRKLTFLSGVPRKEVVMFSRQISTLFQAKVPLLEALRTMMDQMRNPAFKDALMSVIKEVDAGSSLSKSLSGHKKIFSDFYVSMVRSGEASGKLEEVFGYLADGLEREYYLLQKVKGAMTYPAFIIFGFLSVMFVMMVWVVPNLTSILKESGAQMPLLTRIVVAVSDGFANYWWAILAGIFAFAGGFWYYMRTAQAQELWDRVQLKIPMVGGMFSKFYLARMADSLSVLIQGGLPIVQAIEITGEVVRNAVYKGILAETAEQVKKGNTISSVFKTKKEIPVMVSQMVFVGEESGKLDRTLKAAADFYNKEVNMMMDSLVTIIEPVLILMLGVGVAILLIAILMPMYNVAQSF